MGLFGSNDDDERGAGAMTSSGADATPPHGVERLREMLPADGRAGLWTSDLSVDEMLLCRRAGFEPAGLVLGSSIYHIGLQNASWSKNQELAVLTQATYHARELAMGRMDAEASALHAVGVIGVRLIVKRYEWGADLAEFMAIGTAIRPRAGVSAPLQASGRPFTSALSGQDFYKLRVAGLMPLGLVMGSCVYHVAHQSLRQTMRNLGQNVEMTNYTQALYDARELAMARMQHEATALGAVGVVGADIQEGSHGWGSHVIEYLALGTAVAEAEPLTDVPPLGLALTLG